MDGWELNRQFVRHLENRQAQDNDLYLGDCGRGWLIFEAPEECATSHHLTGLLSSSIGRLADAMDDHHLLSIGNPGGIRETLILKHLTRSNLREYICLDVNETGLEVIADLTEKLNIQALYVVAMLGHLRQVRKFCSGPIILAMLGNHFCSYDPTALLPFINAVMTDQDLFLFDCALLADEQQEPQNFPPSRLDKALYIPLLANKGIRTQDYTFELKPAMRSIEGMDIFRMEKQIVFCNECQITTDSGTICFRKNDIIQMGFTFKYRAFQLFQLLENHGFDILQTHYDTEQKHLLMLTKRKPISPKPPEQV
jgi:uncharacterized SAM-dependent methyltransferase